ncbi:MAG: hypothetical protein DRJ64_10170, partial [Thermoprotei archaeon]
RTIINEEYHGVKLQGPTFVKNALAWGTTAESAGMPMEWILAIIVVIIIVVAAAYFGLRKKS